MMGPMMGANSGWGPALLLPVILLALLAVAALVATRARRPAGPGGGRWPRKPNRRDGDGQPVARHGEDPLITLRERYACGEISHAEFVHVLDQLLPTEHDAMPSSAAPAPLSRPAPRPRARLSGGERPR